MKPCDPRTQKDKSFLFFFYYFKKERSEPLSRVGFCKHVRSSSVEISSLFLGRAGVSPKCSGRRNKDSLVQRLEDGAICGEMLPPSVKTVYNLLVAFFNPLMHEL